MRVAVLSTYEHRSSDLADLSIVFKPGTDLAILNYVANHIIETGRINQDFVDRHTTFLAGVTDIGYGLRPEHPLKQKAAHAGDPDTMTPSDFEAYRELVSEYTLDRVAELSGVEPGMLEDLASSTPTPTARSCRSGRWGSTSMSAASGPTRWSTTSIS